jgi:hypothetical protein
MYLLIGLDPVRYRPAMLLAAVAKGSFAVAVSVLYALGRVPGVMIGPAVMDATFVVLFIVAYLRTPREAGG